MTDRELHQRLERLQVPAPSAGAKERAWYHAELALRSPMDESERVSGWHGFPVWMASAATCVLIAAAFFMGRTSRDPAPIDELRLLAEIQRLFPSHLQAIIRSGDRTEILTSVDETTYSSQPLTAVLRLDGREIRILSFSGQRITARIDGRELTLEFLATAEGAVIITGDNFVWRSDRPHAVGELRIEAQQLTARL